MRISPSPQGLRNNADFLIDRSAWLIDQLLASLILSDGFSTMHQAHLQQIECLITLAEELHFGRTAERLSCSQSRVSQLIAALEAQVGARLADRTSRRVALTRAGEQFLKEVRPAYRSLPRSFERARRGALEELRVGFTGMVHEEVTATFRDLHDQHGVIVHTHDLPLGSPFAAVLDGEVDAVIAELPVQEPELTVGLRFSAQDQFVAVSTRHPLADREAIDREELAGLDLVHRIGDAPGYWMAERTPPVTPSGTPIPSTIGITTVQQGLTLVASGRHAMLACRPMVEHHSRTDLRYLPVRGLEASSQLGLVWRTDHTSPALFALAQLLEESNRLENTKARPVTLSVVR